jgi:diguanylate cyclase (GGDEF)-like protein
MGDTESAAALQRELQALVQFVYLMPCGVLRMDAEGEVGMINPMAVQLLAPYGLPLQDGPGLLRALCPALHAQWTAQPQLLGTIGEPQRVQLEPSAGATSPVTLQLRLVRTDPESSMLTLEDVSLLVEQERRIRRQELRLGAVLQHVQGYTVLPLDAQGTLTEWNPSIGRMLMQPADSTGMPIDTLLGWEAQTVPDSAAVPRFAELVAHVRRGGWHRFEGPVLRGDATALWVDGVLTPVVEPSGETSGYVAVLRDATEHHAESVRLQQEALTDALTALPNRRALQQRMQVLMARGPGQAWCVALADIDHFKRVNDTWGHEAGDRVLREVAQCLAGSVRPQDMVARLGGEEFVLLLDRVQAQDAMSVVHRIRQRLVDAHIVPAVDATGVTASFGVACWREGQDAESLLREADSGTYAAKSAGRNTVCLGVAERAVPEAAA